MRQVKPTIAVAVALYGLTTVAPAVLAAQGDTGSACQVLAAALTGPQAQVNARSVVASEEHRCSHLTARLWEAQADGNWFALASAAEQFVGLNEPDSAEAPRRSLIGAIKPN